MAQKPANKPKLTMPAKLAAPNSQTRATKRKLPPLPAEPPFMIVSDETLAQAIERLRGIDAVTVDHMTASCGAPPLRKRAGGFEGLAWIVIAQQVSTASALAIFARFSARFGRFDPAEIVAASDDDLKACGLSTPKVRAMRAICEAIVGRHIDLDGLTSLSADDAHARLVALKGIGPWSADVYLLFCLGHPDVWPVGDLALQEAARVALGLKKRPDHKSLERIGERWRPWRAAAARLLWAYYASLKQAARPPDAKPRSQKRTAAAKR
jgi:DNA-3-methyladenine glycosylase II